MRYLRTVKNMYVALTVCSFLVGGVLLVWPQVGLDVLCKIYGVLLVVYGLAKLSGYFTKDLFQLAFQFDFGLGIVTLILGFALLFRTGRMMEFLSFCIGIFMVADAALKIQTAMDSRRFGITRWWMILVSAVAVAVVGAFLLFAQIEAVGVLVRLIGLGICFDGIMNLIIVLNTVGMVKRSPEDRMEINF